MHAWKMGFDNIPEPLCQQPALTICRAMHADQATPDIGVGVRGHASYYRAACGQYYVDHWKVMATGNHRTTLE